MAPEPRTKGHLSETIGFIWKWALCFTNFFQNSKQPDHRAIRQTDDLRSVIRCLVQHDATLIAVKLSSAFFLAHRERDEGAMAVWQLVKLIQCGPHPGGKNLYANLLQNRASMAFQILHMN